MARPPRMATWLLNLFSHPADASFVLGDMEEMYVEKAAIQGKRKAGRWYWGQVLRSTPYFLYRSTYWCLVMLKNYFKIALRNLVKQKGYTAINISGLAVSIACALFILLWIQDETQYNRIYPDGERIHQVMRNVPVNGRIESASSMPKPLAEMLKTSYAEIEETAIVRWPMSMLVSNQDQAFREEGTYASASYADVFEQQILAGSIKKEGASQKGIIITEQLAEKLFGQRWLTDDLAIGQDLQINRQDFYTVDAVIANAPRHSTLQYDFLLPIEPFFAENDWVEHWGNNAFQIYAKVNPGTTIPVLNRKIADAISVNFNSEAVQVFLHPFEKTYLYTQFENGHAIGGRIEYIRIFSFVAAFLLLIAVFNFTNLATARSINRAREIGVRKTIGAHRRSLIMQFMGESLLFSLAALLVGFILVLIFMSSFNELTGKDFGFANLDAQFFLSALGVSVLVGLLAGCYPALYLSGFNPLSILRGKASTHTGAAVLRKGLVSLQFTLSVMLIVATVVIYFQVQFIQNRDIGLDRENVIYLAQEGAFSEQFGVVRQTLLERPGISHVSAASTSPLSIDSSTGDPNWAGRDPDDDSDFHILGVSHDFIETMDMEIVVGRSFSMDYGADSIGFIVNEVTAQLIGDDVLGKELSFWGRSGPVIGVVKNFEMNSIYEPTEPVIMGLDPFTETMYIRTKPGQAEAAVASLASVAGELNNAFPFDYGFLDQQFEDKFRSEIILGQLARLFAIIAIFVSCLGLLGLVSFTAQQRTKELGVRKVLGASVFNLVRLLTGEVARLVLLGILVATPISYWLAKSWLLDFEHPIDLNAGIFIGAGLSALLVALLTVSFQALKAALVNPADSLRYE